MCYITLPWQEVSRIVPWKMVAAFSGLFLNELLRTGVPSSSRRDGTPQRLCFFSVQESNSPHSSHLAQKVVCDPLGQHSLNTGCLPWLHKDRFKFSQRYKNGGEGGRVVFPWEHAVWCFQFWPFLSSLPGIMRTQGLCPHIAAFPLSSPAFCYWATCLCLTSAEAPHQEPNLIC